MVHRHFTFDGHYITGLDLVGRNPGFEQVVSLGKAKAVSLGRRQHTRQHQGLQRTSRVDGQIVRGNPRIGGTELPGSGRALAGAHATDQEVIAPFAEAAGLGIGATERGVGNPLDHLERTPTLQQLIAQGVETGRIVKRGIKVVKPLIRHRGQCRRHIRRARSTRHIGHRNSDAWSQLLTGVIVEAQVDAIAGQPFPFTGQVYLGGIHTIHGSRYRQLRGRIDGRRDIGGNGGRSVRTGDPDLQCLPGDQQIQGASLGGRTGELHCTSGSRASGQIIQRQGKRLGVAVGSAKRTSRAGHHGASTEQAIDRRLADRDLDHLQGCGSTGSQLLTEQHHLLVLGDIATQGL